ncbi:L-ribulose-5-phosphate 4-epimerase [Helcococcus kunzii ATCC 51366]|uniref:L-ribulose-5-phosphate 4-epimerase n=1 Tax=Helcococcus kunzii ATCC 51366 TaxID=883114 RepID=H3NQ89_9FIRM|nr:class II aldolase/adducin family protein [Helcococcus kunzii]EHR32569.1 L-ribulose-5-phosphate 4-epimerase [Helcococcus kunzii ATCC 51366]
MLMKKEREEICAYSKKLVEDNLTKGTAGNISIINREFNYIAITPSGMNYLELKPEDIVVIDMSKNIIEGNRKPSSECDLHIYMYKLRDSINSVVHTHSIYCTVLASMKQTIKPVHYVLADVGAAEVPISPYHTYGTKELAKSVYNTIGECNACLMENHGIITVGKSLNAAYGLAATCEWVSEIQWKCLCAGTPNYLSKNEIDVVIDKFKSYGQKEELNKSKNYFS